MKKILVVDDVDSIRDVLKDVLSKENFEFLEARDGIEALEVFKSEQPDLVLLDILMPKMNGLTALDEMKKIRADAKIIIISAVDKNEVHSQIQDQSIDGYLTKPFDIIALREQINKLLGM